MLYLCLRTAPVISFLWYLSMQTSMESHFPRLASHLYTPTYNSHPSEKVVQRGLCGVHLLPFSIESLVGFVCR